MDTRQAIDNLSKFVRAMIEDGVRSKKEFNVWKKKVENIELMTKLFAYQQKEAMPKINSLVTLDFHPQIPVLLLNYTQVAHNTLHEFPKGWTMPLRQCRGIVFDFYGNLLAKPFPKFFNYGQHPESTKLPDRRYTATEKKDGHLGIIFEYKDKLYITTRGSFTSPTVAIAQQMLEEYIKNNNWQDSFCDDVTVLVEILHPKTRVYTDYQEFKDFILIGAYSRSKLNDYNFTDLQILSEKLQLPLVRIKRGKTIADLLALIKNKEIKNQEGFVIHFDNDLRVKLKFESYIGLMVADKLSYKYLMQRAISGNLDRMLETLPEEVYQVSLQMLGKIYLIMLKNFTQKQKWTELYQLVPEGERTTYYKTICREFVKQC
jgi:RNA ligase